MTTGLTIGIDLGGTQVRAALVKRSGEVLARAAALTDVAGGPVGVISQLKRLVSTVSEGSSRVVSVGMCAPGPLDSVEGRVLHIPTLPGWDDYPIRERLSDELRLPVIVENDGIAAVFGEWRHGAGMGLQHLVYATVSTGIGGGVVVDGRLMRGRRGMAAHVGHFQMVPEGPACSCGALGCFEAMAAGTALGKAARAAARANPRSLLATLAPPEHISAHHVVEAARKGDDVARAVLNREAEYLGIGFTGLIHLYSPERVIMGGGVSAAFDLLADGIHAVIRTKAMHAFQDVEVVAAGLGNNSGLIGAAALAFEAVEGHAR